MTEGYLEPYKADYLLSAQLEKVQFEKKKMESQLESANKRLHALWTDIWLYAGMLAGDIVVMVLAWILARLGNLPIRIVTVPIVLIALCLLILMGPMVLYRLSKSIILYLLNFKSKRYVRFLHKYDIVTYAAEASKCQRVLTAYYEYVEQLEDKRRACQNNTFCETREELTDWLDAMDIDQKVKVASPFGGKMNTLAKWITLAVYILPLTIYLLCHFCHF